MKYIVGIAILIMILIVLWIASMNYQAKVKFLLRSGYDYIPAIDLYEKSGIDTTGIDPSIFVYYNEKKKIMIASYTVDHENLIGLMSYVEMIEERKGRSKNKSIF